MTTATETEPTEAEMDRLVAAIEAAETPWEAADAADALVECCDHRSRLRAATAALERMADWVWVDAPDDSDFDGALVPGHTLAQALAATGFFSADVLDSDLCETPNVA